MGGQDHIGSAVQNDCVGTSCSIIEKLIYLVHVFFVGADCCVAIVPSVGSIVASMALA